MKTSYIRIYTIFAAVIAILSGLMIAGCSGEEVPPPNSSLTGAETTSISIFYPNGKILIEERQIVPLSNNMPEVALKRLFAASPQEKKMVVVLPEARVKSVKVDKKTGVCAVDFSKEILEFPESENEKKAKILAFASIIETLKQFPEIDKLLITVEGKKAGVINGKKIEDFWWDVSLKKQPIKIVRKESKETTEAVQE